MEYPPHPYCMYVIALVDKNAKVEEQDQETMPTLSIYSVYLSAYLKIMAEKEYSLSVIYQLDANAYFDHIGYALGELGKNQVLAKEPILVGIGNKNAYLMDSLRVRDYTFPKAPASDSLAISGGAEKFYAFLKQELIPYIDKSYRTDTGERTLMGHSFGGYFTLYALLQDMKQTAVFNSYVAASPSLDYHDYYLMKAFESLTISTKNKSSYNCT